MKKLTLFCLAALICLAVGTSANAGINQTTTSSDGAVIHRHFRHSTLERHIKHHKHKKHRKHVKAS